MKIINNIMHFHSFIPFAKLQIIFFLLLCMQARSKLPKKRRRVLPVEQPRRKRETGVANRRMNAMKHQHHTTHPALLKDAFGSAKIGKLSSLHFHCVEESFHNFKALSLTCRPHVCYHGV